MSRFASIFGLRFTTGHALWAAALIPACILVFARLELLWLWDGIGSLPRSDRWQTQARSALRDDLLTALADLTENVLASPGRTVDAWWGSNERSIQRAMSQLTQIRRGDGFDITNLSVALRQLRNLALTSVRHA